MKMNFHGLIYGKFNSVDELVYYIHNIGHPGTNPSKRFTQDFINYLDKNMEWEECEVRQGGSCVLGEI